MSRSWASYYWYPLNLDIFLEIPENTDYGLYDPLFAFLISKKKSLKIQFIYDDLNGNFSFFIKTYLSTRSFVEFKHCIVELKKQVFPKFLRPL